MKLFTKVGSTLFAMAALAAMSLAGDVTGTWHGHAKADLTKVHQPRNANEKSRMVNQIKQLESHSMTLSIRADHTFTVKVDKDSATPVGTGTWKLNGNKLILLNKAAGRGGPHEQVFTIASNGKSFGSQFGGINFTFTR